jgi:aspartate aminotransferase
VSIPGLSLRAGLLKPSPTLSITAKANALKAQGIDVVSFGAGEPDFNTPEAICETTIAAIQAGFTKYTPSAGIKELREAIAQKLTHENRVPTTADQVVVSCGAKHSVYNCMQLLLDPGDEVLLIAPYWMTYAEQIKLAGGVPVVVYTTAETGFVPTIAEIAAKVSARTKAIVINSPSNPTGAVLPRSFLEELAALAVEKGFWVISDEIYEKLIYGETHLSIASLNEEIAAQTITIGGCSKTYAMTGWRIGFAAAPLTLSKAMSNFQDQVTSNPTSFVQKGAVTAFQLPPNQVEAMREEFQARRDLIVDLLADVPGFKILAPKGAFYAFVDVRGALTAAVPDDVALSAYLLEEAKVSVIPGSVFEGAGHLRLSYAASRHDIERGVARIREAVAKLAQA